MKRAIIKRVPLGYSNRYTNYIVIPRTGNAPMLLLEVLAELELKANETVQEEDSFRIHINGEKPTLDYIVNYINNNL